MDKNTKYEFLVKTYSYDRTGYYVGYNDELVVTLTASNTEEARKKAIEMRKTDPMNVCNSAWGAKVINAKEIRDES